MRREQYVADRCGLPCVVAVDDQHGLVDIGDDAVGQATRRDVDVGIGERAAEFVRRAEREGRIAVRPEERRLRHCHPDDRLRL